jgi:hypothetical protein
VPDGVLGSQIFRGWFSVLMGCLVFLGVMIFPVPVWADGVVNQVSGNGVVCGCDGDFLFHFLIPVLMGSGATILGMCVAAFTRRRV